MTNPFHFFAASPNEFVGRWPLVRAISDELVQGISSYGIVGGKRCGKSSVLAMIQYLLQYDNELGDQALTLLVDPMGWEGELDGPAHFWTEILRALALEIATYSQTAKLDLAEIQRVLTSADRVTATDFARLIGKVLEQLEDAGGPRRLVLLIDEMDSLIDYGWHTALFGQIRALLSGPAKRWCRLVSAGSRRFVDQVSQRGSPLFNILQLRYLTPLSQADTALIVRRYPSLPVEVENAVGIYSGGHPYLATYLLHHLWESNDGPPAVPDDLTEDDVKEVVEQFLFQQSSDLNPWAETIGLAGLQIYGLFLTTNDWRKGRDLRGIVNDKTLPVADALTALAYHNFIVPNARWSEFRRGSELFRRWYEDEIVRLTQKLTPDDTKLQEWPAFFRDVLVVMGNNNTWQQATGRNIAQAAGNGTAAVDDQSRRSVFDQRDQTIQGNQTNIAGDVNTGGGMVNTGTTYHSQDRSG